MLEEFYSAEICRQYPRTRNIFTQYYKVRRGGAVKGKIEIRGVHGILKNNGKDFFVHEDVKRDIKQFRAYLKERKNIDWKNRAKKDNLRKVAELEKKFGTYELIK